jgi:hypothetical protein
MSRLPDRLWDGSETGWTLQQIDEAQWTLTITHRSTADLLRLRRVVPMFRDTPVSALRKLGPTVVVDGLGNTEARRLHSEVAREGLVVDRIGHDHSRLLAVRGNEVFVLDPELDDDIRARMVAAGGDVRWVHVD